MVVEIQRKGNYILLPHLSGFKKKNCRSENRRYITFKEADFIDTYLKLSVLKTTFEADDKCQTIGAYFKCLYSPEVKEKVKSIVQDKSMKSHLKKKYKLSGKEVKNVLKFFETLDTSCEEKGACKM